MVESMSQFIKSLHFVCLSTKSNIRAILFSSATFFHSANLQTKMEARVDAIKLRIRTLQGRQDATGKYLCEYAQEGLCKKMKTYDSHSGLRAHYRNFHKLKEDELVVPRRRTAEKDPLVVWARAQVTQERSRIRPLP
jgi:hypothetical protein